ncbi:MAG: hypothetical protein ACT4PV_07225 [Planctomycetaceae bacterium]
MRRLFLLILFLAGCGSSGSQPFLSADALREGCVGSALDLLQELGDRLAPLAEAADETALSLLALLEGAELQLAALPGDPHVLRFEALDLRGGPATVRAEVRPTTEGASIFATIEGPRVRAEGLVDLLRDAAGGIRAAGTLLGSYDGCEVDASFDDLWARTVADLPERPLGALFLSGTIDLAIRGGSEAATGKAAFAGRDAFVILTVGGVASQGPILLRPAP